VTCSECGLVVEPGFGGRNLLRFADREWLVHLQRGLRASRVLSRLLVLMIGIQIAMILVGMMFFSVVKDSRLELHFDRIMPLFPIGIILTVIGMPLTVWWMTQPEAVSIAKDDHVVLRMISLLFLPLVGAALGFASPLARFNLAGTTVMVLCLGAVAVFWCHAMLMCRHLHSLLERCDSPDSRKSASPIPSSHFWGSGSSFRLIPIRGRRHNFLRWVIPGLAILYVIGPLRWGSFLFWTPPDKGISDLLIGLAALAWFQVYFEYGQSCLRSVKRELESMQIKPAL